MPRPRPVRCAWCKPRKSVLPQLGPLRNRAEKQVFPACLLVHFYRGRKGAHHMTEAEALKRFIPILGRISTPHERQVITRNILERIAGQQTSVMGINHSQAGALAWPADPAKAKAFENALNVAVDGGEFLSLLHRHDRRHFQIEELASWPDCPAIAPDSPLTFWLGEPLQRPAWWCLPMHQTSPRVRGFPKSVALCWSTCAPNPPERKSARWWSTFNRCTTKAPFTGNSKSW